MIKLLNRRENNPLLFPRIANMSQHVLSRFLRTCFFYFSGVYTYDLYFDTIDNDDDDDEEHVGDFDAFSPGHSQYLAFSFDGLGGLGDKGRYPFRSIDFRYIYSFTRSMS